MLSCNNTNSACDILPFCDDFVQKCNNNCGKVKGKLYFPKTEIFTSHPRSTFVKTFFVHIAERDLPRSVLGAVYWKHCRNAIVFNRGSSIVRCATCFVAFHSLNCFFHCKAKWLFFEN